MLTVPLVDEPAKTRPLIGYLLPVLLGAGYVTAAISLLYQGHLHEDAYILFQYSYRLATGLGITFDAVSGRAEGATDFLWMVSLAALHTLGLELGTAAALLNGTGLALSAFVIVRLCRRVDLVCLLALALLVISGGTAAGLVGFSAQFFGGIFSLLFLAVIERRYTLMSSVGLVLALTRPDGVLLAAGSVVAAFVAADRAGRIEMLRPLAVCAVLGIFYFVWRLTYFGLWLPLPLLVKTHTDSLFEGVQPNLAALGRYLPLLVPLLLLAWRRQLHQIAGYQLGAALAGPGLLLIALSFAHQSQNIGYRFQYPVIISLIFIYIVSMRALPRLGTMTFVLCLMLPLIGLSVGATLTGRAMQNMRHVEYINTFPQMLRDEGLNLDNIAITEAGRFPYWYSAQRMTDLVGLNSAAVVMQGAEEVLSKTRPKYLFVHHADRYKTEDFDQSAQFVITDAVNIKTIGDYTGSIPVFVAPHAALSYAQKNNFVAVLVKYGIEKREFLHVHFLSRELDMPKFIRALEKSLTTESNYYKAEAIKQARR
jgi:hypothetical protein